jgi:hypothetical protein
MMTVFSDLGISDRGIVRLAEDRYWVDGVLGVVGSEEFDELVLVDVDAKGEEK